MAEEIGRALIGIEPKTDNFEAEAKKQIEPQIGNLLKGLAAGVAAKKIFDFGVDAFKAADEVKKIAAQTEAVIKSTGGAANITGKQVSDLANSISKVTAVDDEAIQQGENLLLTFKNVRNEAGEGNDIFNQTTKVMVDMAAAMGTDASGGAIQLGKALNDPTQGIAALTRVGVTFTDQQKDQIKALQDNGDLLGAQKVILAELTSEFEGSAAAQATSADRIALAFDNLKEEVGAQLTPIIGVALDATTKLITGFGALPGPLQSVVLAAGGAGAGLFAIGKVMDTIHSTSTSLAPVFTALSKALVSTGADGTRSMTLLGKAVTGLGIAGVAIGFALMAKQVHDSTAHIIIDVNALSGATDDAVKALAEHFATVAKLGGSEEPLFEAFRKTADQNIDAARRLRDAIGETGQATGRYDQIIEESIASSQRRAISEAKGADAIKETGKITEVTKDQLDGYNDIMKANEKAVDKVTLSHEDLLKTLKDGPSAINDFVDAVFALTNADANWNQSLDDLRDSFAKNGKSLDIWTEQGRANSQALQGVIADAGKWLAAIFETEGASEHFVSANTAIRDSLTKTFQAAGFSKDEISKYLKVLDAIPAVIETEVRTTATFFKGPGWEQFFAELNRFGESFGAEGGTFVPTPLPHFALGGTTKSPGGLVVVGERGPELAQFGTTTTVFPNNLFQQQMLEAMKVALSAQGGGGATVNVFVDNVSHGDADEVGAQVGASVQRVLTGTSISVGVRQGSRR